MNILRSMLTCKKINKQLKKVRQGNKLFYGNLDGGLGHCLHNLAWAYKFCVNHNSKLYHYIDKDK